MAVTKTMVTSSVISTTSQHKRDYAERIRRLYPSITRILALVKGSNLDSFGNVAYSGKGMINKSSCFRLDPEHATYTAPDLFYTATGGSSTTAVVADNTLFAVDDKIVNTTTGEVAIINTLEVDGVTLTVTAITGTTWSCSSGDILVLTLPTYEEGSSRYGIRTKELDTNKTYLQVSREAIALAETMMKVQQYTNEGIWERYSKDHMIQFLRKLEGDFITSKQATSGTTSVTIGGTAYPLYSMNGILSYAGSAIDMRGAFTWETFNSLYPLLPKTISPDETLYFMCGRNVAQHMNMWAQNKYMVLSSDSKDLKFGAVPSKYIMAGAIEVEILVHEMFDNGDFANQGVFFPSSDLEYLYMEGLDVKIVENIQNPSVMGRIDEIRAVTGLRSWSAGANIKRVKNLLSVTQ